MAVRQRKERAAAEQNSASHPPVSTKALNRTFLVCAMVLMAIAVYLLASPLIGRIFTPAYSDNPTPTPKPIASAMPTFVYVTPTAKPYGTPTPFAYSSPEPTPVETQLTGSAADDTLMTVHYAGSSMSLFFQNNGTNPRDLELYAYYPGGLDALLSNYYGSLGFYPYSNYTAYAPFNIGGLSDYNAGMFSGTPGAIFFTTPPIDSTGNPTLRSQSASAYSDVVEPILQDYSTANLTDAEKAEFQQLLAYTSSKSSFDYELYDALETELETLKNEANLQRNGGCGTASGFVDLVKHQFILRIPLKDHTNDVLVSHTGGIDTFAVVTVFPEKPSAADKNVTVTYDLSKADLAGQTYLEGDVKLGYSPADICDIPVKIEIKNAPPSSTGSTGTTTPSVNPNSGPFSGTFDWPVAGSCITCEYKTMPHTYAGHTGVDIGVYTGTVVNAAADGTVIYATTSGWNGGCGNGVELDNGVLNGKHMYTLYCHFQNPTVTVGQHVSRGQQIGLSDNTGHSTGPHLHFEVRVGSAAAGSDVNPHDYLSTDKPHCYVC